MAKRGRPPVPTTLKILRGNPGKRPLNENEPIPEASDFEPPEWLTGEALGKWERTYPILRKMRLLTVADEESFARYCALWAEWKRHYEFSKQPGGDVYAVLDADGSVKYMSPTAQTNLMMKIATILLQLEREFGLTPSSRSTMSIHESKEEDPLSAFAKSRSG